MTTPAPPNAAPPDVLAGQILQRYGQVLAQYQQRVAGRDCPVARRWQAATGSSLADFPGWLARLAPLPALVAVITVLSTPPAQTDHASEVEPGAEVLLQMALLALVRWLAQHYATALQSAAGYLLHLPKLQDTVLALLVACRCGVAVHLAVRYDSKEGEQLVVTNLITDHEETQVGKCGVQDNIDTERKRLLIAQSVMNRLFSADSPLLGQRLPDEHLKAFVDHATERGLTPIVVLAWHQAEVARDIEHRWGVRTALRGDPANAQADDPQRASALQFADAGQQVEPYFDALARLLRRAPVATAPAPSTKPLVFISYAREDLALQQRLCTFLSQHRASVSTWTDQDLQAGQRWKQGLLDKLAGCQVVVVLLSVDFNVSNFIQDIEMPEIQRRHAAGQLHVVPVVAGPCELNHFPWLAALHSASPPEQPLLAMEAVPRDAALNTIAASIARIAQLATQAAKDRPA